MKTRGRDSAAALSIAQLGGLESVARPDAPYKLTDEQAQEWWSVVSPSWTSRRPMGPASAIRGKGVRGGCTVTARVFERTLGF